MINIENEYRGLVSGILGSGVDKDDRTGVGTKSVFGRQLVHDMSLGFPLLTNKKMYFNSARTELLWILHGKTDMKYLQDNNVTYWDADYKRSGRTDGTLGPVYGAQWRKWKVINWDIISIYEDQLFNLVKNIKENPSSRRLMVNAWNVGQLEDMALPPCHVLSQFHVTEGNKLSCTLYQRSADMGLGVPFNIASYSFLTHIIAKHCDLEAKEFVHFIGNAHIYDDHVVSLEEQITKEPFEPANILIKEKKENIEDYKIDDFEIINYKYHKPIRMTMRP